MELKFDANQDFQLEAIAAVGDLLDGQRRRGADVNLSLGAALATIPNCLDLDDEQLLGNVRMVQARAKLPIDDCLRVIEDDIATAGGTRRARFPNFSVEMETGTGKTYVYLRTALELYRRYGLRKYIVVVPKVAVREGVLKTLEITRRHLRDLYGNVPCRYAVYDSANLSQVRQFALSDGIEILVMTIDSFNKASNVIRQPTDRLQGGTPVHLVQAARPILILDEPQNMESELAVRALALLDPLFALRYSATHRNAYNLVHRLTPFDAYRHRPLLVKRIEVAGVEQRDDANEAFVRLDGIRSQKTSIAARVTVQKLMKDGTVKEASVSVAPGDDLQAKANRAEYAGFTVDEISPGGGFVRFTNGVELRVGETRGPDKAAIFEAQIRYTIEEHFRKQARLRPLGLKVLSLFFIDRVENYARDDGLIRCLFRKCFEELKVKYPEWRAVEVDRVQAAYFASRRTRGGDLVLEDSRTGESEMDREAYDLIMRDKERLLSFEEPTCFIFSHSALREGWDNPNVFQICTLNQTSSEVKKRQEIGRGVRLAVDQDGERNRDERVNILTVVANESYERYVALLQSEVVEEYGVEGAAPKPANARKRGAAHLRKEYQLRPEFQALWDRIRQKTRYAVTIDSPRLVAEVVRALDASEIRPPQVAVTKAVVEVRAGEDVFAALQMSGAKTVIDLRGRYPLPNVVEVMSDLLERTTPPVRLTRATLLAIVRGTRQVQAAVDNPHEFATVAVRVIREKLGDQLVGGIRYERISEWYEMTQFEAEVGSWKEYLVPADRCLYDSVVYDSDVEKQFVLDLEARDDVKMYIKLPAWFTVPTPIGDYNPDWAIVVEPRDEHGDPVGSELLFFVRETKDADFWTNPRPHEV